ncbi:MAG: hypothetical protein HZC22_06715 [Rhodocyclales bacterium]|nr:hypothetical protein [Rhodocyclales bacterium]
MPLSLASRTLTNVRLIDDDPALRAMYRYSVDDLELNPVEENGPIGSGDTYLSMLNLTTDAVICDLNLKTRDYSSQNGDELVSTLYSHQVPVVLCTRYADELPDAIRHRRRKIPIVLSPKALSGDTVRDAFLTCLNEFEGNFSTQRKPWRTVVRVESGEAVGTGYCRLGVVVPAWDPNSGLTFVVPIDDNAALMEICKRVQVGEEMRVFAQVNLGAESAGDIYIDEWALQ